jgi:hypothetical protein
MNHLYSEIPQNAIPEVGTIDRAMLDMFMTGEAIPEQTLYDEFGRNCRSYLQKLRGDRYSHWRFIEIKENGVIEARYLDPRHLSGDRYLDSLARAERRKELRKESHIEAMNGASRIQQAYKELEEATEELEALKGNAQQKPSV